MWRGEDKDARALRSGPMPVINYLAHYLDARRGSTRQHAEPRGTARHHAASRVKSLLDLTLYPVQSGTGPWRACPTGLVYQLICRKLQFPRPPPPPLPRAKKRHLDIDFGTPGPRCERKSVTYRPIIVIARTAVVMIAM